MVPQISVLVLLVDLIDVIPGPASGRKRGRPPTYPERLCLKALVIMLVRDVTTVDGLLAVLDQPTPEMRALRERLTFDGRFPSRRTWERRLNALPDTSPARTAECRVRSGALGVGHRHSPCPYSPRQEGAGRAFRADGAVLVLR